MGYFKFFILYISFLLIFTVTGCSNKETLGDIASSMLSYQYVSHGFDDNKDSKVESYNKKTSTTITKRGAMSWISSSGTKAKDSQEENNVQSKIIDNTIVQDESSKIEVNKIEDTNPDVVRSNSFNFFKYLWDKTQAFRYAKELMELKKPFKVDTISTRKGLNLVVLKVPQSEVLDKNITEFKGTLTSNSISDNFSYENNSILNSNLPNQRVYKDYLSVVKYKDYFSNRSNSTNDSLTSLHKDLIDHLLSISNNSPSIIYVFYRDYSHKKGTFFVDNQLSLSSYLYKIRFFIYSKKLQNTFIQEVRILDLPVDQILIVLKPITKEQFSILPKQTNLYNASQNSIQEWLSVVNNVDSKTIK